jgi:hypothetical protein
MPIRPDNRSRYPDNWMFIRKTILARAQDRCEQCGVPNHAVGYRDQGRFVELTDEMAIETADCIDGYHVIKIVLTIAHLDHRPENNEPANLRALCQRCHLAHDFEQHLKSAWKTRRERLRTADLFDAMDERE